MSKMNLSRCAAVGIAGLTAMSSVAVVAAAATQTSMLYELKYNGIETISMKGNTTYGNGNQYCNPDTAADDIMMDGGFVTTLTGLTTMTGSYNVVANGVTTATALGAGDIWVAADFDNASTTGTKWAYTAYGEIASGGAGVVKLVDPYQARTGITGQVYTFMNEADRTAAKNTMMGKIKTEYSALAAKAQAQFRLDINDAKATALKRAADAKQGAIDGANAAYEASSKTADDMKTKNETIQTANNKYNAISNALNTSSTKIISEFNAAFNANNFVYDYKTGNPANDTFGEAKAPVSYSSTTGGLSGVATATYTSVLGTALNLTVAMYNLGSTVYNAPSDYVFKGELQTYANITGSQLVGNGNWRNFQVIDNNANSGGNTNPDGSSTSGGNNNNNNNNNNTTTATTWYPDSSAYRAASDVSYQGQNGSWYTSASAAELYGGGYTGASKNSNFSSVNSSNTEGKAIYFNSSTGTYSTTSSTYSYIVKEATSTPNNNDDPYYNYFFGNGGGSSTTNKVPSGSPTLNGTRYAGWTNIANYITARGKSGTVLTINMNEGTVVPSNVLSAAKSKNVTLTFKNKNGSTVTVRPSTSMAGNDLNTTVTYNVKDIKSSLVTKAKKVNSAVSSAQIRVGADGSIGGTETVGVKFSTSRSGYTVKAYRLTETGSLRKEATGTINSSGRVNLNLTKGGSYVLVVCR